MNRENLVLLLSGDPERASGVESQEGPPQHEEPHQGVLGVSGDYSVVLVVKA